MALQTWKGSIVRKQDIFVAKNYLTEDEIDSLNRFVVVFLETAELRAKNRQGITMDFWRENVDKIIAFNDKKLLTDRGSISNAQMEKMVEKVLQEFDSQRKIVEAQQADNEDLQALKLLEEELKKRKK